MALQGPVIDAMGLADGISILLVQAPHGIEQILHLLGVQGHQRGHRGARVGHRGQRGVTGDSGGVSAAHHDFHTGLGVELGHGVPVSVDTLVCLTLHLTLADQTLAHLSTIKRGDLNELISQTSSRIEVNLHGALNELHGVSVDYSVMIQRPVGAVVRGCAGSQGGTVPRVLRGDAELSCHPHISLS